MRTSFEYLKLDPLNNGSDSSVASQEFEESLDDLDPLPEQSHTSNRHASQFTFGLVPTTDDPSTPSLSLRVILIGSAWCIFLSLSNAVFSFRTTSFSIPGFIATLLSYPMGVFLSRTLPHKTISLFGVSIQLNQGEFSIKEHVLTYIIASGGAGIAYGLDNVVTQRLDMFMGNESITFWESLAWVMTSQFIGFGMAGLMRRFLVKPSAMLWPQCLSTVALFVGFHEKDEDDEAEPGGGTKWRLTRYQCFWVSLISMFVYSWFPLYIAPALQSISILCYITSQSELRFLSTAIPPPLGRGGVGLGTLTLDWSQLGGGFLTSPWWAQVNFMVGNIIWGWILTPLLFYSNAFGMDQKLQIQNQTVLNTGSLFNRDGIFINAVSLYNKTTFDLDEGVYTSQSPIYITSFFALSYGARFMSIAAAFTHVYIWHGADISRQFKSALRQMDDSIDQFDIHNKLMRVYPDIAEWKYLIFLIGCTACQMIVSLTTPFSMPIWAVFLCICMALASILPIGVISAISGTTLGLNVLTEFIIGLLIPGKTIAVMTFKSLGTNSVIQALNLLSDLKLGHYMKINPVHMVFAQLYGTFLGAIFNTAASFYVMDNMRSLLGTADWGVSDYSIFYNAGAIWGAIGPQRFFGVGSVYESLLWCFLVGFVLPFVPWALNKVYPSKNWELVNVPLLASCVGPGRIQNFILIGFALSWFFQNYLFRHHHSWWIKYNYILAIGLDCGVAFTGLGVTVLQQSGRVFPRWMLNPVDREAACR